MTISVGSLLLFLFLGFFWTIGSMVLTTAIIDNTIDKKDVNRQNKVGWILFILFESIYIFATFATMIGWIRWVQ